MVRIIIGAVANTITPLIVNTDTFRIIERDNLAWIGQFNYVYYEAMILCIFQAAKPPVCAVDIIAIIHN